MSAVFVSLVIGGVFALLAGMVLTRTHWRRDIPPYGRGTRFLDVTRRPERYTDNAPLGAIRALTVLGAALIATAVMLAVVEIVRTSLAR